MPQLEGLQQFAVRQAPNGVVHLVFDAPGRPMNVFSNAAIRELNLFVAWLRDADVRGVVISSGKGTGFCAGADLDELGVAYDMIVALPAAERSQSAYDHFFPLSAAIRGLETSGKAVAVAIGGLALGAGCELAMGCHYRVLSRDPKAVLGLPEALVGLLPGGGGTQRLPRLVGVAASLPVLLEGGRLSGEDAVRAGLVHKLAEPGEEIAEAEAWVLSVAASVQPWDEPGWRPLDAGQVIEILAPRRQEVMAETQGHYPAPIAILKCLEDGLALPMDDAIRAEMKIFADLVQRREPRNMIRALFRGRLDYEKLRRTGAVPEAFKTLAAEVKAILEQQETEAARAALQRLAAAHRAAFTDQERRAADYLLVTEAGLPAYRGGLFVD
jgi:3-hydroxyacyl-CoA dehydrogenase/enoyl-CoA hydratase/3-hydroxybutyryl-CoA epimerase